jgi:DNA-directed RNA polymerase subunit RPC12/RpoP
VSDEDEEDGPATARLRCARCRTEYVSTPEAWEQRTCRCPRCKEWRAARLDAEET